MNCEWPMTKESADGQPAVASRPRQRCWAASGTESPGLGATGSPGPAFRRSRRKALALRLPFSLNSVK